MFERELFSGKFVEKIKTRILWSITFYLCQNRSVFFEILWKIKVEPDRPRLTVWRMRIACWMLKATNTHSEYAVLTLFPLRQWLHKRVSVLGYPYFASLVLRNHRLCRYEVRQTCNCWFFCMCPFFFLQRLACEHYFSNFKRGFMVLANTLGTAALMTSGYRSKHYDV